MPKLKAVGMSETSMPFNYPVMCQNPEDRRLNKYVLCIQDIRRVYQQVPKCKHSSVFMHFIVKTFGAEARLSEE